MSSHRVNQAVAGEPRANSNNRRTYHSGKLRDVSGNGRLKPSAGFELAVRLAELLFQNLRFPTGADDLQENQRD
jgi:hypothetical protein